MAEAARLPRKVGIVLAGLLLAGLLSTPVGTASAPKMHAPPKMDAPPAVRAPPAVCTDEAVYSQLPEMIQAARAELMPMLVYSITEVRPADEPEAACTATLTTSLGFKVVRFWPVVQQGKTYIAWTFNRRT